MTTNAGRNTQAPPPHSPRHLEQDELAHESTDAERQFHQHCITHGIPLADYEPKNMNDSINLTQLRAEIESDNVPYVIAREHIAALIDTAEAAIPFAQCAMPLFNAHAHTRSPAVDRCLQTLNRYRT